MMRFFGSSAPAAGAGPGGQVDSLRIPARIAAPKLIASFLLRLAASLGLMLSVDTGSAVAGPAAEALVVDAAENVEAAAVAAAGSGIPATSPPLTERGVSATQAVRAARARAARRGERTEDMYDACPGARGTG